MSTRGAIGFRIDGKDKLTYNHSDSYPSWLGVQVLKFLKEHRSNLETLKEQAKALKFVPKRNPTKAEIEHCQKIGTVNLGVSKQSVNDWYCLTREAQGDLAKTLELGFMSHGNDFMASSLFCEWAYVINFDSGKLEVYQGFNHGKHSAKGWVPEHTEGRYAHLMDKEDNRTADANNPPYFGVWLVAEYPLNRLPAESRFLKELEGESE